VYTAWTGVVKWYLGIVDIWSKFDIALRQNCDQSATVWWSTQSSAQNWRIGERCLILNKSADDNTELTWTIRDVLLEWLVPMAREQHFHNRAYGITIGLDWWVHQGSVGQRRVHMMTAHSVMCCFTAHWTDCAQYIPKCECLLWIVQTMEQFCEKSRFTLLLYRNISRLEYNLNMRQYVSSTGVKRMRSQALSWHEMQPYVGTVTLKTLYVLIIYWPKMATNGIRQCTVCRTEVVINTTRNRISVERDMKYHSPKISI
jgi:hypothetical protein